MCEKKIKKLLITKKKPNLFRNQTNDWFTQSIIHLYFSYKQFVYLFRSETPLVYFSEHKTFDPVVASFGTIFTGKAQTDKITGNIVSKMLITLLKINFFKDYWVSTPL